MVKCIKCGINERNYKGSCKECYNKQQRERRIKNNNSITKKYEKTIKGFLVRLYRNMKSRITGIQKEKHHLYQNKELLDKVDFYEWALNSDNFNTLFIQWEKSEYDRKLTPSVDRIDSSIGYVISNMEWVTHSENSKRGVQEKIKKYKLSSKKVNVSCEIVDYTPKLIEELI